MGSTSPSAGVYAHVSRKLGLLPQEWLFVDDTLENLLGAKSAGIRAHHFKAFGDLRDWIDAQLAEP